jgi:hypothetical protein
MNLLAFFDTLEQDVRWQVVLAWRCLEAVFWFVSFEMRPGSHGCSGAWHCQLPVTILR